MHSCSSKSRVLWSTAVSWSIAIAILVSTASADAAIGDSEALSVESRASHEARSRTSAVSEPLKPFAVARSAYLVAALDAEQLNRRLPQPSEQPDSSQQPVLDVPPETGVQQQDSQGVPRQSSIGPLAQFQLPKSKPSDAPSGDGSRFTRDAPPRPINQFLKYQYSFGSESDAVYRKDRDLDTRLRDDSVILAPQLNGFIIYRPTDWLETMLEMILEREIAAKEEKLVTLPTGETVPAEQRRTSLAVDQLYAKLKGPGTSELTLGRRNFEDERRWLYDTSLDGALGRVRYGNYSAELSFTRKDWVDMDLLRPAAETRIDNYMLYVDYRGIQDSRLAAYTIFRDDRTGAEGRPWHMGLRAYGKPTDNFNYWGELALLRGTDEAHRRFKGYGIDVGATYRFAKLPWSPAITLAYAYGSGDDNPDDGINREFRQTGLQSNEAKFAGVSKFKYYGEALDPELSNVQILTLALGFRPAPNVFVDLVYHNYRLNELADEIRNWALTAQMSQVDSDLSKDVGNEIDIVVGFRNLFGVRRLGVDLRMGWFFPGRAFLRNEGTEDEPNIKHADVAFSVLAKFWW